MINNSLVQNCKVSHPSTQFIYNDQVLGKIELKNIYHKWNGENAVEISSKHQDNPYSLRIGMPSTDAQMKSDRVFFILNYLSYNPLTKDIENRQIIPLRNIEKVYIGQSIDEKHYKDYSLFVDGTAVVGDLFLKNSLPLRDVPLTKLLTNLMSKVEKLQLEVSELRRKLSRTDTYNQENIVK